MQQEEGKIMSWWISLHDDDGNTAQVELYQEGGTQVVGGTTEADLNVTYNYSEVTRLVDFNFQDHLHGKKAKDTVELLEKVVFKLGDRPFKDYWAPTPGNAGHAAAILLRWAKQHPEHTWHVN